MTGDRIWRAWDRWGLLFMTLAAGLVLAAANARFRTAENLANFVSQAAIVAITGAGMTLAIAAGGFDLSVGSVLALAACVGARTVNSSGVAASVLASLAAGAGVGLVNGVVITKFRVPTFIATLATMVIVRGAVLLYTGGRDVNIAPERIEAYGVFGGRVLGVPAPIVIMALVYAAFHVLLRHTRFGRHACALGSNEGAAVSSGLAVDRIRIAVFAIVAVTAAVSGVVQTSQIKGVSGANAGLTFELQAISVVVLGGTSLRGGRARLLGTATGAILVAMANNCLNLYNTPAFYQQLAMGLILLAAVSLDGLRRRAGAGSRGARAARARAGEAAA